MSESNLNEHKIGFVCVGTVSETSLELKEDVEVAIGKREEGKTVKCKQITGKVAIDTGNGIMTFFPRFNEIGYNGEEDGYWKMALAMLDWNPKIKGDSNEPPTRVILEGNLNYYDGYVKDGKEVELKKSYQIRKASTRIPASIEEDGFSFEGDFFIASAVPVEDDEGEVTSGKIKAYYSNYRGEVIPVDCVIDKADVELVLEGADDFEAIKPGQTRRLKITHFRTEEKSQQSEEKSTGRRLGASRGASIDVPVRNKFKDEYVLTYASAYPVEEPEQEYDDDGNPVDTNSVWYNPVAVKKAVKARAQKLEEMENNPPKKKDNTSKAASSLKASKQAVKSNKAPFNVEDDEWEDF